MNKTLPNKLPRLTGLLRTNWSKDPYAYGSYSFTAVGATRLDHQALTEPVGHRLFFAGEATNLLRNSTVNAALETGRSVAQEVLSKGHLSVGIVGAGIAGIVAAHSLSAAGREVRVIEARDRIGERIFTDHSLGVPADLGASWLHGDVGNPLTEIIDVAGMRKTLANIDTASWIARDNGESLARVDLPDWIAELALYDNSYGTAAGTMNELAYENPADYGGDEYLFPDGYAELFNQFSGSYLVSLDDLITAVEHDRDAVRVRSKKATYQFDAVIVTVPLGVLKAGSIEFSPALPLRKTEAIQKLGVGLLDKLFFAFRRRVLG